MLINLIKPSLTPYMADTVSEALHPHGSSLKWGRIPPRKDRGSERGVMGLGPHGRCIFTMGLGPWPSEHRSRALRHSQRGQLSQQSRPLVLRLSLGWYLRVWEVGSSRPRPLLCNSRDVPGAPVGQPWESCSLDACCIGSPWTVRFSAHRHAPLPGSLAGGRRAWELLGPGGAGSGSWVPPCCPHPTDAIRG